ncbi:polyprenyl synthetase family protein [Tautonia rosea]|nr:polyprenyl synthetase family protein [Tautonia rosea]
MCKCVLNGGKRIRPRLCLASYRIVSGTEAFPPRPVWQVASSLEIFHSFMLVHDDLIDESVVRRDQDALHEALRREHDRPDSERARKLGHDLALLGGDLMFALGMRMVSRSGIDPTIALQIQSLLSDMLLETGLGEALDVLYDDRPLDQMTEGQIVEAYIRKTARYSISGPLVLGAMLAQAPRTVWRALDRYGDLLGLGYQIRNDLDAMAVCLDEGDHPDLDGGKRTLLLWTAYQRLSPPGQLDLEQALASPPTLERRRRLDSLIRESGAIESCEDRLRLLQEQAHATLLESPLDPLQRRSFLALVDLLPGGVPSPLPNAVAH